MPAKISHLLVLLALGLILRSLQLLSFSPLLTSTSAADVSQSRWTRFQTRSCSPCSYLSLSHSCEQEQLRIRKTFSTETAQCGPLQRLCSTFFVVRSTYFNHPSSCAVVSNSPAAIFRGMFTLMPTEHLSLIDLDLKKDKHWWLRTLMKCGLVASQVVGLRRCFRGPHCAVNRH